MTTLRHRIKFKGMAGRKFLAGLAVLTTGLGLLACGEEAATPPPANQPVATVSPTAAGQTPSPTAIPPASATLAPTIAASPTGPVSAASGPVTTGAVATTAVPPDPAPAQPTAPVPPPGSSLVLPTPLTGGRLPLTRAANEPVTRNGTLTGYDQATNLLTVLRTGGTFVVKVTPATRIVQRGVAASLADLKAGLPVAATGLVNPQGQLEATSLEINPPNVERPIGPPGFPEEKM